MSENATVAEAATQKNTIALDELVLLGTFGTDDARTALVRHTSGRIEKVAPGNRVGRATVVAIDADSLVLKTGSRTRRLQMPQG
ncbi:hypothetical protein [Tropicimonas sp.]|uniref:hypothetical protein n=1 Tax=Tropicimonas sp. TaxID=2067044 RepID=UPI003A855602